MDKKTDFAHFRQAILDFNADPTSAKAKQVFDNWRHHCFMNYPVGEVLKLQGDTYAEIGQKPIPASKFPRRWLEVS